MSAAVTIERRCSQCGQRIDSLAAGARFCSAACKQRAYRRRRQEAGSGPSLTRADRTALLRRHEAAMQIIHELGPDERLDLLAAVVWPEDDRLRFGGEAA
jgi:hypothetical protein